MEFLLEPVQSGIGRRALLEVALVGAFCGALGFWVVTERLAYAAEVVAHGLLPGLVLATIAGAPLLLGAAGGALAAAALLALAARDERIGPMPARLSPSPGWSAWARCSPSSRKRRNGSRSCSSGIHSE